MARFRVDQMVIVLPVTDRTQVGHKLAVTFKYTRLVKENRFCLFNMSAYRETGSLHP